MRRIPAIGKESGSHNGIESEERAEIDFLIDSPLPPLLLQSSLSLPLRKAYIFSIATL